MNDDINLHYKFRLIRDFIFSLYLTHYVLFIIILLRNHMHHAPKYHRILDFSNFILLKK